jgi:hypothetical protein
LRETEFIATRKRFGRSYEGGRREMQYGHKQTEASVGTPVTRIAFILAVL